MANNDFNENENQNNDKKELEDIEGEEKEIFLTCFNDLVYSYDLNNSLTSKFYLGGNSVHLMDIHLPPPEHNI